jgi:hypothetical protein
LGFGILKDGRRKAFEADMNREDGRKGGANQDLQNVGGRACEGKRYHRRDAEDAEKRMRKTRFKLRQAGDRCK